MGREASPIRVSEATNADVEFFAVFFREAWRQAGPNAPGFAGATDDVIAELTSPAAVRARIGGPERRMYLAWEGGRVVGFAATKRVDAATADLAGIIVLEAVAGRGVGSQLVAAAVGSARSEGYRTMIVRTEVANERAKGFYERRGFAVTDTTTELVEGSAVEVWELSMYLS